MGLPERINGRYSVSGQICVWNAQIIKLLKLKMSDTTFANWSLLIINTTFVGSYGQLSAYIGAIILGRWTVIIVRFFFWCQLT
jgi:hypothetical protein